MVVVGSGAGGGVVAARLAESGRDVLVVEAAPYVAEPDLPRDELDGFNRLYLDHGLVATGDLSLAILAGAAVGGGTLINWTTSLEPPDWVRHEWAAEHGLEDFDGASTDRHLARLREELAFSAPPNIPAKDQLILDGAAALGWEAGSDASETPPVAVIAVPVASAAAAAPSAAGSGCTWRRRPPTAPDCSPARRSIASSSAPQE